MLRMKALAGSAERWSERLVEEALRMLEESDGKDNDATLATIWRLLALAHGTSGRYGLATRAAEHAMKHARRANDGRQIRLAAAHYALAALHGPTSVPEAVRRCEEIASEVHGDRRTQGMVTNALAALRAMGGDFDDARRLYREAQAMLEELGPTVVGASTSLETAWVERLAGDLSAAERELRRDYGALQELGEKYLLSTIAAELARVLYLQGRLDDAEQMSRHAQDIADVDDIASQTLWRMVYAKILARKGNGDEAMNVMRQAMELLEQTDAIVAQADMLIDLAEVLKMGGRPKDANAVMEDALALLDAKGNAVAAEALRVPVAPA